MKIAIISDIHGNLPALESVIEDIQHWNADQLIINGDLINRGTLSLACLAFLQQLPIKKTFLKGNHEDFVISCEFFDQPLDSPEYKIREFAHWTYEQVFPHINTIKTWQSQLDIVLNEQDHLHITHGTKIGNRDGIAHCTTDGELTAKVGQDYDFFITSHTHQPLIRQFNKTLILNTGSVGSPFDGDKRSSYGRFWLSQQQWKMKIQRVSYDHQAAINDYYSSGFLEQCGELPKLMLRELELAKSLMGGWMHQYSQAVLAKELTFESAVQQHLANYPL